MVQVRLRDNPEIEDVPIYLKICCDMSQHMLYASCFYPDQQAISYSLVVAG